MSELSQIGANFLVKDDDGEWEVRGRMSFAVLPRVGEHVQVLGGENGVMARVALIVHPSVPTGFVDIYAAEIASPTEYLKNFKPETSNLTPTERLILWNQYYALSKLYPDEAKFFAERCEILEQGFTLFYATQHIDPNELGVEDCREVINIMTMFRVLLTSYKELTDKTGIREHDVNFEGFDGNEEGPFMVFVRFLVETQNKFQELKAGTRDDFNSHMPRLDCYRRMLAQWDRSKKYELTKEDILRIVGARNRFTD